MKVLFQLNHPAHYHLVKNSIRYLKHNGHEVQILARGKDVLKDLLQGEKYSMLSTKKGLNIFEKIRKMEDARAEIIKFVDKSKPDIVVGTGTFSYITRKLNIPTVFLVEDDANLNLPIFIGALSCYFSFSEILSPEVCYNSLWDKKSLKYNSYHELAYLHPNHFTPDIQVVENYFPTDNPYFIIRFAKLNAYHDIGIKGINTVIAQNIIDILKPHGDIYITSERELEPQFERYRIKINPLDMHHVMAFAQIYIGDSQTMAAESGVLGVPFVRFNDFVGRIGYLNELEDVYKLGYGIKTNELEKLYSTIRELINMKDRTAIFAERRAKMLSEKIDFAQFLTWFIENYPESARIMKENPDYQYRFK